MKMKKTAIIPLIIITILSSLAMVGCGNNSTSKDIPINNGDFKLPEIAEDGLIGNDTVAIDASNSSQGYIAINYQGDSDDVKLQIVSEQNTYTYNLVKSDQYAIFPLSNGDGTYSIQVYENLHDNQYALVCGEKVDAVIDDDVTPFLYPNYYVNYTADSKVVALACQVTSQAETQLDVVSNVYDYVVGNIEYDYDKAASVEAGYIPDPDQVIEKGSGICFDYASLMTAMLRIRNIPAKLVVGYSGDVYHAWISVYISDVGWVSNVIEFDGTDWTLMDPTFAASSSAGSESDYVNNQDQYHALYFY